jgi:RNA polymerase sigma-70 factor (ECF subfamily)
MLRLQGGEDLALKELMNRWQQPLANYILRQVGNEAAAIDLAQEAFVRLYQSRDRYEGRAKFSTWLYTIATNLCRNHHRWRARHPNVSLDAPASATDCATLAERLPDDDATPAEAADQRERAETVRAAVAALPEELRSAVILSEYEDLSHAEIAAISGCTAKAVETRLYRARQFLREKLSRWL